MFNYHFIIQQKENKICFLKIRNKLLNESKERINRNITETNLEYEQEKENLQKLKKIKEKEKEKALDIVYLFLFVPVLIALLSGISISFSNIINVIIFLLSSGVSVINYFIAKKLKKRIEGKYRSYIDEHQEEIEEKENILSDLKEKKQDLTKEKNKVIIEIIKTKLEINKEEEIIQKIKQIVISGLEPLLDKKIEEEMKLSQNGFDKSLDIVLKRFQN